MNNDTSILVLGWIGIYAQVALAAIGASIGCTTAGQAAIGAMMEVNSGYCRFVGLSALPSSMSIYGEGQYHDPATGEHGLAPGLRPEQQLAERRWELESAAGDPLLPERTAETKPLLPTSVYAVTKRDH